MTGNIKNKTWVHPDIDNIIYNAVQLCKPRARYMQYCDAALDSKDPQKIKYGVMGLIRLRDELTGLDYLRAQQIIVTKGDKENQVSQAARLILNKLATSGMPVCFSKPMLSDICNNLSSLSDLYIEAKDRGTFYQEPNADISADQAYSLVSRGKKLKTSLPTATEFLPEYPEQFSRITYNAATQLLAWSAEASDRIIVTEALIALSACGTDEYKARAEKVLKKLLHKSKPNNPKRNLPKEKNGRDKTL